MAANDIYLDLKKDAEGESKDAGHLNTIELLSFSFNGHIPIDAGTFQAYSKLQMSLVTVVKHTDKASAPLLKAMFQNKVIPVGTIYVRKAGTTQQDYLTCELKNVSVASFSITANAGEQSQIPVETIQFSYNNIKVEYKEQTSLGTVGGTLLAEKNMASTT